MPKTKTHRGAAKRFRATGGGHLKRNKGFKSHLATHKSRKRKRHLRASGLVHDTMEAKIKRLVPYL